MKLTDLEKVRRFQEWCLDMLDELASGVECEHETVMTEDGTAVCIEEGCPMAWADRVLVDDWWTALHTCDETEKVVTDNEPMYQED